MIEACRVHLVSSTTTISALPSISSRGVTNLQVCPKGGNDKETGLGRSGHRRVAVMPDKVHLGQDQSKRRGILSGRVFPHLSSLPCATVISRGAEPPAHLPPDTAAGNAGHPTTTPSRIAFWCRCRGTNPIGRSLSMQHHACLIPSE